MRNGNATTLPLVLALLCTVGPVRAEELELLSAASMQTVFKEIIGDFERNAGRKVRVN